MNSNNWIATIDEDTWFGDCADINSLPKQQQESAIKRKLSCYQMELKHLRLQASVESKQFNSHMHNMRSNRIKCLQDKIEQLTNDLYLAIESRVAKQLKDKAASKTMRAQSFCSRCTICNKPKAANHECIVDVEADTGELMKRPTARPKDVQRKLPYSFFKINKLSSSL